MSTHIRFVPLVCDIDDFLTGLAECRASSTVSAHARVLNSFARWYSGPYEAITSGDLYQFACRAPTVSVRQKAHHALHSFMDLPNLYQRLDIPAALTPICEGTRGIGSELVSWLPETSSATFEQVNAAILEVENLNHRLLFGLSLQLGLSVIRVATLRVSDISTVDEDGLATVLVMLRASHSAQTRSLRLHGELAATVSPYAYLRELAGHTLLLSGTNANAPLSLHEAQMTWNRLSREHDLELSLRQLQTLADRAGARLAAASPGCLRPDPLTVGERVLVQVCRELCWPHPVATRVPLRSALDLQVMDCLLDDDDRAFLRNSSAHLDLLVKDHRTGLPLLAIELDGPQHDESPQLERDAHKDRILRVAGLPLLRMWTRADEVPSPGTLRALLGWRLRGALRDPAVRSTLSAALWSELALREDTYANATD